MGCGCGGKRKKRGSGVYLKGVTWKGPFKKGGAVRKRRRRRKKKASGMSFTGQGINFSGQGISFTGQGLRVPASRHNGKRVL